MNELIIDRSRPNHPRKLIACVDKLSFSLLGLAFVCGYYES